MENAGTIVTKKPWYYKFENTTREMCKACGKK